MQKCTTLRKKSQKREQALREAHIHCGIKEKRLLTPVSNRFVYMIHYFSYLLDNKPEIEDLYGTMAGIHDNIRARMPSLVGWEAIKMIVTSMKRTVGSTALNQCYGKEWLLLEAILDLVRIYTYF